MAARYTVLHTAHDGCAACENLTDSILRELGQRPTPWESTRTVSAYQDGDYHTATVRRGVE